MTPSREELIRQGEELAKWLDGRVFENANFDLASTLLPAKKVIEVRDSLRSLIALIPNEGEVPHHRELMALEYGYRGCEKGKNLEKTISDFKSMIATVRR